MAKLTFTHGPMNSLKSGEVLAVAHNYESTGKQVLVTKPSKDKKGGDTIESRGGAPPRKADFLITPGMNVYKEALGRTAARASEMDLPDFRYNALLVDEANFLETLQVDQLRELATFHNLSVMAFGLMTDFQSQLFPGSQRLVEVADNLEKRKTMCNIPRCDNQAVFNARRIKDEYTDEGEQIAIDGIDADYHALCARDYLQLVKKVQK